MRRLGSSPETIRNMLEPWVQMVAFDCFLHVIANYRRAFELRKEEIRNSDAAKGAGADRAVVEQLQLMDDPNNGIHNRLISVGNKASLREAWEIICEEPGRWPLMHEADRTALQALIAEWDPEMRFLFERADLLTPSKWFRIG
jgi:hypothetical protein